MEEEGLTHLVAYVGEANRSLSPALETSSRFMDCLFDGVCVHVVPRLPDDMQELQHFRIAALIGPSGSGTSTLARELFGLPPDLKWSEHASVRAHLPRGIAGDDFRPRIA